MRSSYDSVTVSSPARRARAEGILCRSLLATLVLVGCGGLEPVEPFAPITNPQQLYMSLTLDRAAVNLSVAASYRTQQLTATPRDANGTPLSGLPPATFRSSDTTRVWVTPDGLIEARAAATGVRVIADLVVEGNVRHADTTFVNVTTNSAPRMLDTLSIEPLPPASTIWSMFPTAGFDGSRLLRAAGIVVQASLSPRAVDATGIPVPGLAVEYESLNPEIVKVDPRTAFVTNPFRPGEAAIVARTTAYGITRADTAHFTVTLPVVNGVGLRLGEDGEPLTIPSAGMTIRAGGYAFWTNGLGIDDTITVTFDDPTNVGVIAPLCTARGVAYPAHCEARDIAPFPSLLASKDLFQSVRGRHFPVPGIYSYRIDPLGITGRVVVTDDATP